MSEDLGEVGEFRDVANEPQEIRIQKHKFFTMLVQVAETRLVVEVVGISDARRQIRQ